MLKPCPYYSIVTWGSADLQKFRLRFDRVPTKPASTPNFKNCRRYNLTSGSLNQFAKLLKFRWFLRFQEISTGGYSPSDVVIARWNPPPSVPWGQNTPVSCASILKRSKLSRKTYHSSVCGCQATIRCFDFLGTSTRTCL